MAKQKYYTVWAGHKPGIYTVWAEAEKQVRGFANAKYKSFPTELLAEQAFKQGVTSGTRNKAPTKHAQPARADAGANAVETDVAIYCDGACDPNPGKAGTGIATIRGKITRSQPSNSEFSTGSQPLNPAKPCLIMYNFPFFKA